ncbi:MAG TPA: cytochrome C oxidase subunit IV family protein [Blastocatellia bacterium]|nr:cytochrome C oxidase subunit IV family protein [Blastocatellia bacterium]
MSEPVITGRSYLTVLIMLLFFTLLTYEAAFIDLGRWNTPVAIAIAICKASLVILYFMHVRYSSWLTWVVIAGGLFWLGIMLTLTLTDYVTRVPVGGF